MDTSILDKALHWAVDAHAGVRRKGKELPYIVHPIEAVAIVATMTTDQELLAAAALHDVVEDTAVSLADIRAGFGPRVADLVAAESHCKQAGWRGARQQALQRLAVSTREEKIVAMGDKLSNMRAIARDYRDMGDALWSRFAAPDGRADYAWYYCALCQALADLSDTEAYQEFLRLVGEVFDRDIEGL